MAWRRNIREHGARYRPLPLALPLCVAVVVMSCARIPLEPTDQYCRLAPSIESELLTGRHTPHCDKSMAPPLPTLCDLTQNAPLYQSRYAEWKSKRLAGQPTRIAGTFRFHFNVQGQPTNAEESHHSHWEALHRGLQRVDKNKTERLVTFALNSKKCPNPLALALAVRLETRPAKSVKQIIPLYETASLCEESSIEDRQSWLLRGGLYAIWTRDTERALPLLKRASDLKSQANRTRSLYWLQTLQPATEKSGVLRELERNTNSFHSVLALEENTLPIGAPETLSTTPELPTPSSEDRGLYRHLVRIDSECNRPELSKELIRWALPTANELSDSEALWLAKKTAALGMFPESIVLSSDRIFRNRSFAHPWVGLAYPTAYEEAFKSVDNLDPFLLLAVARQESALDPKIRSSRNAVGLLQLLPETARRFGKVRNLSDPSENVLLASRYLGSLIRKYRGSILLALAAYNAGPGRADQWVRDYPTDNPILFMDLIPYRETRDYVAGVLRNYYWYRRIYSSDTKSLSLANSVGTHAAGRKAQPTKK